MFMYQAHQAFAIWHNVFPKIDEEVESLRVENESLNEVISDLQLDVPEADEDLPF